MSVTVLGTTTMEITPDPIGSNVAQIIVKKHVVGIYPVKIQVKQPTDDQWTYPYDTITKVCFCLVDGRKYYLELQSVSNQPGWNDGTQAGMNNAVDDIKAWLAGGSLTPGPAVLVNPSTISFANTVVNAYSASQTLMVSGNHLTNNIILTAPAGYIINLDGSNTNASPMTLVQVAGNVAPTTVYVKFHPVAVQNYNATITATSIGALTQNVTLFADAAVPDVTSSQSSLSFSATEVDYSSAAQSFNVSGVNLYANLIVTAPAGFIINLDGSETDAGPVNLVPASGVVALTTVYIRFKPTSTAVFTGNVTITSTSAVTENIAVDGLGLFSQNRVYSYYHNI